VFQRNKAIEEFKPEQYFSLDFQVTVGNSDPLKVILKNKPNRFVTNKEAMEFYQSLPKKGLLKNIKVKKQKKTRPRGLNTVNMLKFVTKNLGMSSHQAMHAAERLYLSGYMTYPRTESTQYPGKFDFKSILGSLKNGSNLQYS
jgi:DNA topoisomerase-3